ncbi:MAG: hypothetical protein ACE5EH_09940 [Gammaproteobacteria bacterium]
MKANKINIVSEEDLVRLEESIHELIKLCTELREENAMLKDQQSQLNNEQTGLIKKNELAQGKLELMLKRLKTMEVEL